MPIPTSIDGAKRYLIKGVRSEGDLTTVYDATYANGGGDNHVVVKVARDTDDNDLVLNEAGILGFMFPPEQSEEKLYKYLPRILDAFETKEGHRVNVLSRITDFVSMADVLKAYPTGLDFRDVVWMYKRLLVAIGFAHSKGVIHGAVLPPHVMVHPVEHGAKVIDWSYALNFAEIVVPKRGRKDPDPAPAAPHKTHNAWEKLLEDAEYDPDPVNVKIPKAARVDPNRQYIRAMCVEWEKFYAPEILMKMVPTPATDIFMAAKCAVALLGGNIETNQLPDTICRGLPEFPDPKRARDMFQAFLQSSLLPSMRARPQDAWDLHESFDKLLLQLVGKPSYRPFSMPASLTGFKIL